MPLNQNDNDVVNGSPAAVLEGAMALTKIKDMNIDIGDLVLLEIWCSNGDFTCL
jgi:hypothetical protein